MAVDIVLVLSALLVGVTLALVLMMRYYQDRLQRMREDVEAAGNARRRTAVAASRLTEWAPFLARYPYDPRNFRAVGGPVDGIQVEADRVVLVRFHTADRPAGDARIRDLVAQGRVEWLDFALDAPPEPPARPAPEPALSGSTPPPPPPFPPPAGPPP